MEIQRKKKSKQIKKKAYLQIFCDCEPEAKKRDEMKGQNNLRHSFESNA